MHNYFKNKLLLLKSDALYYKGIYEHKITDFDIDFYKKMDNTYIGCEPLTTILKDQTESNTPYEKSIYMFSCFDNATLVCANINRHDLLHSWVEIDNFVYDPLLLKKFDKDTYYEIYKPTRITKYEKEADEKTHKKTKSIC